MPQPPPPSTSSSTSTLHTPSHSHSHSQPPPPQPQHQHQPSSPENHPPSPRSRSRSPAPTPTLLPSPRAASASDLRTQKPPPPPYHNTSEHKPHVNTVMTTAPKPGSAPGSKVTASSSTGSIARLDPPAPPSFPPPLSSSSSRPSEQSQRSPPRRPLPQPHQPRQHGTAAPSSSGSSTGQTTPASRPHLSNLLNTAADQDTSLRPKRSRKDRPCDHCRRSKRSCFIAVRGQACANCARSGRECSFVAPPLIRHPKEGDQSPLNPQAEPLQSPHAHTRSPHQSATSSHQSGSASSLGLNGLSARDARDSRDIRGDPRDIRDIRDNIRDPREPPRDHRDDRERELREMEMRHREVERGREKDRERDREQRERERQRDGYFHSSHGSHGSLGGHGQYMHGSHASLGSPRSSAGDSRHGPSPMVSPQLNFYPTSNTAIPRSRSRDGWMGDRSSLSLTGPSQPAAPSRPLAPGTSVLSFLDSLDDAAIGAPKDSDGYTSLDLDVTDEEESHYLGSGAVAQLASVTLGSLGGRLVGPSEDQSLEYRQVADPRYPAYFLKNPSKVYGHSNAAYVAEKTYAEVARLISHGDPNMPEKLIQHFLNRTLPYLPIVNRARFEASLHGWKDGGTFPAALLVGIFAHSAVYEPSLAKHYKELWSTTLHTIDNEYRQARLQTIQLEILCFSGWPVHWAGGNHIGICRAIGAMQLIGLHRDCSRWKLPKWERSLRKRLWWVLYVHDKWNAYTYGRPVNIPISGASIPPVTFDDDDGSANGPDVKSSELAVFIASTRLATILESLMPLLLERQGTCRIPSDRTVMRQAAADLEGVYRDLPSDLIFDRNARYPPRPGARALQLSHIGLEILICRLGLDQDEFSSLSSLIQSSRHALRIVDSLIVFLETLTDADYHAPWNPWSPAQTTNAAALLLRQALKIHQYESKPADARERERDEHERVRAIAEIVDALARLIVLVQGHHARGWEVAGSSIVKIAGLVRSNIASSVPGIQGAQVLLDKTPGMGAGEWPNDPALGNQDILAVFEWLHSDMGSTF